MKPFWKICLALIFLPALPVSAGVIETIEFNESYLLIDRANGTVRYGRLECIQQADKPSVPFLRRAYRSAAGSADSSPVCRVIRADTIALGFEPIVNGADLITTDIGMRVNQPIFLELSVNSFPSRSFHVFEQRTRDAVSFTVLFFPVQYLEGGRIIFNRQVEVIGDEACGIAESFEESLVGRESPCRRPTLSPEAGGMDHGCPVGSEYVVVTSPELAESFAPFVELKRQTGFDAVIALTDSIYAYYNGCDGAESLRRYLLAFYEAGGQYVLLGGDEDHLPVRYAYYYNTDTLPDLEHLMICDLYFADVTGDWDSDGDGVWGEPTEDSPDMGPELSVGRLPLSRPSQVSAYTAKLRKYLFDPGGGDPGYLDRAIFLTSDQMRDYFEGGQQYHVAEAFPDGFAADCERLAESPNGSDPSPVGPFVEETIAGLSEGYGLVNVLAHGRPDGFVLSSSEYNQTPKTYLLTGEDVVGHGMFSQLAANNKTAFYYSIACTQGAFDCETLYGMPDPSSAEKLLAMDSAGAIGILAFSRWGWVGSSYKLMTSFYRHLFDDAAGSPVEAMHLSYADYPYYRDQIYGQDYFGDPSLILYRDFPARTYIDIPSQYVPGQPLVGRVTCDDAPLAGYPVTLAIGSGRYETRITDADGFVQVDLSEDCLDIVDLTVYLPGAVSSTARLYPVIAADADDDVRPVPAVFALHPNRPNPFNPSTMISFSLGRAEQVSLQVYDILGRLVSQPLSGRLEAGDHQVTWTGVDRNGRPVASGIYICQLVAEEGTATGKMMLVR